MKCAGNAAAISATRISAGLAFAAASCGLAVSPASAESIYVEGVYPAAVDLPDGLAVIVTEPFGGDLGPDTLLGIVDALGAVEIEQTPYFQLRPASALGNVIVEEAREGADPLHTRDTPRIDAVLRGSVRSEVIRSPARPKIRKECVERDDEGECIERVEVEIPCRNMEVSLSPRIQLVSASGDRLYSRDQPVSQIIRFCRDEGERPSPLREKDEMIDALIEQVRLDLAPRTLSEGVRVMESRKDIAREDRRAFKDAVKLTDNDPYAACLGYMQLEETNTQSVSVLFNIGLCHEADGSLDLARDYYSRALQIDPGRDYPSWGMDRINARKRAIAQLEARGLR